jgi:hypothetical protein
VGPGEPLGTRSAYTYLAGVTPLLVLLGLVAWLFDLRLLGYAAWGLAATAVFSLLVAYFTSRVAGQRNAL